MNESSTLYRGELLYNERLADYTTWRVGGFAKALYKPQNVADLRLFLQQLPTQERIIWLGLGSNSLIKDTGFSGTVILTQGCLQQLEMIDKTSVRVEAGVSCAKMARFCARNDLEGGEFWAGIPGTMGGALRMNAGCSGGETWMFVRAIETMTRSGEIRHRHPSEFSIGYRYVEGLESDEWFIAAICEMRMGSKERSLERIKSLLARRAETQPTNEYNCGSVFRNPPGDFAARLIESSGLKGMRIGGAVVSEKHANFIINAEGEAQAADIEALIQHVQATIKKEHAIELMREVHVIGDVLCQK